VGTLKESPVEGPIEDPAAFRGDETPRLVVSDISPLGLEVGQQLGVPSVLVENFTWDWIYSAYFDREPALRAFAERSAEVSSRADLHIQCTPMCERLESAAVVDPVSRVGAVDVFGTRATLGIDESDDRPLVLLTMGGLGWGNELPSPEGGYIFVTLGGTDRISRGSGLIRLPDRSPVYPPDLIWAADAVIGKLGYSTVAECFRAGARFGFICRPGFPESPILEAYVRDHLPSVEFNLLGGMTPSRDWRTRLDELMCKPRGPRRTTNGADQIAALLLPFLA
jgi:hypothetical protein